MAHPLSRSACTHTSRSMRGKCRKGMRRRCHLSRLLGSDIALHDVDNLLHQHCAKDDENESTARMRAPSASGGSGTLDFGGSLVSVEPKTTTISCQTRQSADWSRSWLSGATVQASASLQPAASESQLQSTRLRRTNTQQGYPQRSLQTWTNDCCKNGWIG